LRKVPSRQASERTTLITVTDNASVVPPVVALVIVERSTSALDRTLAALAEQDAGSLRVLVMDATADGIDANTMANMTDAQGAAVIVRRAAARNFAGAANEAARLVAGSGFLCLISAGTCPEPTALRVMLEEAFRSNAGVVGPKLVNASSPERLESVGYGLDKFAELWRPAAPGELDQEQHDMVVDRFVVPSDCLMIRSDLFQAVGGFDETLSSSVAETDLCWRAHASGARVMVVPDARATLGVDGREPEHERRDAAERVQLVLTNYSLGHLARVLPQALLVAIASALANLVTLRPARSLARLAAWPSALGRLGHIRARRKAFGQLRKVPDADIRRLQQRGSARLGVFLRGRRSERRLAAVLGETSRTWFDDVRSSIHWPSAIAWITVLGVVFIGSRSLLTGSVPAMPGIPATPTRVSDALSSYISGWRPGGLGHVGAAPTGLGLLGVLGAVLLGNMGLARTVATAGLMVIGAIGIWRAARPLGNERARLTALVVYGLVPLAPNAFAGGRWGGLAAYAAAPFVVSWLVGVAGVPLWAGDSGRVASEGERAIAEALARTARREGSGSTEDDSSEASQVESVATGATRPLSYLLARAGRVAIVSALAAAVAPAWLVVVVLVGVALAVGALAARRHADARAVLGVSIAGVLGAVLLHLPWALTGHGFFAGFNRRAVGADLTHVANLLRFQNGPQHVGIVGWFIAPAAFVGLAFAHRARLASLLQLAALVLVGFGGAWAIERRRFPGAESDVFLVVALVAAALAAAVSVLAFDTDVRGKRLSWRQPTGFLAAFAMLAGFIPVFGAASNGSWKTRTVVAADTVKRVIGQRPTEGGRATSSSDAGAVRPDQFRVLWLGDALALPAIGFPVSPGVDAALTTGTDAFFDDRWGSETGRGEATLADGLLRAANGSTSRLGLVLAPAAVRYIVVPRKRIDGSDASLPGGLERVFDTQLDLRRITTGDDRLVIYQNDEWVPFRAQLTAPASTASTRQGSAELLDLDLSGSLPVLQPAGAASWSGDVAAGDVFVSTRSEPGWSMRVDGQAAPKRPAFGWAEAFTVSAPGRAELRYSTPLFRRGLVLLQVALWAVALAVAITGGEGLRRRRGVMPAGAGLAAAGGLVAPVIRFDDDADEGAGTGVPETVAPDAPVSVDDMSDERVSDWALSDERLGDDALVGEEPANHVAENDAPDEDAEVVDADPDPVESEPVWMVASDRREDGDDGESAVTS
jgi:GT2 family glycosyltransferase